MSAGRLLWFSQLATWLFCAADWLRRAQQIATSRNRYPYWGAERKMNITLKRVARECVERATAYLCKAVLTYRIVIGGPVFA